jgi:hypothetical protein
MRETLRRLRENLKHKIRTLETCRPFTCRPGQFQCDNSHCIFPMHICDRNDDCGDRSDEKGCLEHTCYGKQFKCLEKDANGTAVSAFCIPADRR